MTKLSIHTNTPISAPLKHNQALSSLQLLQASHSQLRGESPININGINHYIKHKLNTEISSKLVTAVSGTKVQQGKAIQVFEAKSTSEHSLPAKFASSTNSTSFKSFIGNLIGNTLFVNGQKFTLEDKVFQPIPVKVDFDFDGRKMHLTKLHLMQSVALIPSSSSHAVSNLAISPQNHLPALINSIMNSVLQRGNLAAQAPSFMNRLGNKLAKLGTLSQKTEYKHQSSATLKQNIIEVLNIPALSQLSSPEFVQQELAQVLNFSPLTQANPKTSSFVDAVKFVLQFMLIQGRDSKSHDSLKNLEQSLTQYQQHMLKQLLHMDDVKLYAELSNQISRYQSASVFSESLTSWFFALPYWNGDRVDLFEGHFERDKDGNQHAQKEQWKLRLKFNLNLGHCLFQVDSIDTGLLNIQISSSQEKLLQRIELLQNVFTSRLSDNGFTVNSFTLKQASIPDSLLEQCNIFSEVQA